MNAGASDGPATEVATYFGPLESPLFGVLHLPGSGRVRDSVLICGSLGKEASDSAPLQRYIGIRLAQRGIAAFRFDYLCTGDSALAQNCAEAAELWTASVEHAVSYLTSAGAAPRSVLALRAGSLIVDDYLKDSEHEFDRVVLFDPITNGRRFLREQTSLLRLTVGEGADGADVAIVGARLHPRAVKQFGEKRLSTNSSRDRLIVTRSHEDLLSTPGTGDVRIVGELLEEATRSTDLMVPLPEKSALDVVEWLDRTAPSDATPFHPKYSDTSLMPVGDGPPVRERIERIGKAGLFAIRTSSTTTESGPTTLFCNTSNDRHIGPAREWVELSRQLAAGGGQALRWDRSGRGESNPPPSSRWLRIYSRAGVADVVAAARHADDDPHNVRVVGICSGSWLSAHAGKAGVARDVVMVNPIVWNWTGTSTLSFEWNARRLLRAAGTPTSGDDARSRLLSRAISTTSATRRKLAVMLQARAPRALMTTIARIGLGYAPRVVLSVLARRGVSTTVLLAPEDATFFDDRHGSEAVRQLASSAVPPRLILLQTGDHAAYHPAVLAGIRTELLTGNATEADTPAGPAHRYSVPHGF